MRYIPALDGVRALAVAVVVLYHLGLPWMQGGFQGVTVFFVISGYIITRSLLFEIATSKRIDFKGFYLRRVRRLLPAICVLIPVVAVLCAAFNHVMLTKMRPDIVPSLFFINNWWQIFNSVSYFNALGDPSPLTHFWSLAIEEQFYLVWPLALDVARRMGSKKAYVRRTVLGLAAASAIAMAVLYDPMSDTSRVYYGTDTRAFGMLLGAWLAFVPARAVDGARGARGFAIDLAGVVALVGIVVLCVFTNGYTSFAYYGATLLAALLSVVLLAACARRGGVLARILALPPFTWLGKRSYGIYLWHYPLLTLLNPVADVSARSWWETVMQIVLVLVVSELSYRFIEEPCRHGAIGDFVRALRSGRVVAAFKEPAAEPALRRKSFCATAFCVLLVAMGLCLALVPDTSALSEEGAAALAQNKEDGGSVTKIEGTGFSESSYDVLMLGDSVSVRTIPYFQETFPYGLIDAAESRQFSVGIELLQNYVDQGQVGGIVVIALGTNGPISNEQIDEIMSIAGDKRRVVFVTTRSPRAWVSDVNTVLANAPTRYDNARLVDWYAYSEGRNDLFDGDGTHLNETGASEYTQLIYNAVEDVLPVHTGEGGNDPVPAAMQAFKDSFTGSLPGKIAQGIVKATADIAE